MPIHFIKLCSVFLKGEYTLKRLYFSALNAMQHDIEIRDRDTIPYSCD